MKKLFAVTVAVTIGICAVVMNHDSNTLFTPLSSNTAKVTPVSSTSVIYFAGDSITAGAGSWEPLRDGFVARWTDRVCGQDATCRDRIFTFGNSGGCLLVVCNGKPALKDSFASEILAATPKPTTVVVEIGVNDLFNSSDANEFADAYKTIMYSGIDAGVRVILATIPPTMTSWPWHNAHNAVRQGVNSWLRSYFGADNLWDIDSGLRIGFTGDADPTYYTTGCSSCDGLHPSTLGHLMMQGWLDPRRIV